MNVTREEIDARTRSVVVTGELVGSSGTQLMRVVRAALDDGIERLVIDLTGMSFMDSGGLAALVGAWSATSETGCGFAIVLKPESHAARSLELRGVSGVFSVAGSRESALRMLDEA
jgi:anti-sigma B factor antagonist